MSIALKLFAQFLILQPLRLSRLTDGELAAIGALFRLSGAAEQEMALITSKNHFTSPRGKYITSSPVCIGGLSLKKQNFWGRLGPRLPRYYVQTMAVVVLCACMVTPAFALDDMWTVANRIIVDVYGKIAGVSTVLAGLMSAVAVVGAKLSNNQHKVDQAWDWLKRIWIAWMIINGIGAFIAYVTPLFSGLATLTP